MFRNAVKLTLCRSASRKGLGWRKLAADCHCRWTPVSLKLLPWTCKLCHSSHRRHLGHSCRQVGTQYSHDLQPKPSTCRSDPVHFKQTNIWALVGWQRTAQFFNGSCAPIGVTSCYQGVCASKPDFCKSVRIPRSWYTASCGWRIRTEVWELCCAVITACCRNNTVCQKAGKKSTTYTCTQGTDTKL